MKKKHKQIMLAGVFSVAVGAGIHQATKPIEWKRHIGSDVDYSNSKPTLYIDELERRAKAQRHYHEHYELPGEDICKYWPSSHKCTEFRKNNPASPPAPGKSK